MDSPQKLLDTVRWQTVQDILAGALELPEEEREAFVGRRCGRDETMRAEVLSLVAASGAADDFFGDLADRAGITLSLLSAPALTPEGTAAGFEEGLIGRRLGQYEIKEWLGQGGMATVFLAERQGEGFTQRVALKLVPRRVDDPLIQRRSNEKRRILARLEHRGIARLIDGGLTPEGHPYYAMEYVDGLDVLEHVRRHGLDTKERLRLFLGMCAPVQYAHERLVVHCDLKPSNILVTPEGHVKLLDFGVARLIDPDAAGDAATGLWFTPAYASPEQVRREPPGTASDVYSLGVLLYEMLSGTRPYRFHTRTPEEIERIVAEVVPPRPSTAAPELDGDLDAIVLKALAKERGDRYHTVEEMAADVRRHLDGRPVKARAATAGYHLSKFVGRHRGAVLAAARLVLSLVAGVVGTTWQARRATAAAAVATNEAEKAELIADLMMDMFRLSDPNETLGDTITARQILDSGTERILTEFGEQPVVQARLLSEVASVYRSLGLFRKAEPLVRQALNLRTQELGGESLEVSESLAQFGGVMISAGDAAQGIPLLERSIAVREPLVAFPDSQLSATQMSLAFELRANQRYDEAAALFERVLETEQALGDARPEVATALLGLGATFHDAGRFDEADSLFQRVLADFDLTGRPHPLAIAALQNVGLIRRLREQYADAEPILRTAYEMSTALYGPDHIRALASTAGYGYALHGVGRWDEAEQLFRDGVARARAALGPDHPSAAAARTTRASWPRTTARPHPRSTWAGSTRRSACTTCRSRWARASPAPGACTACSRTRVTQTSRRCRGTSRPRRGTSTWRAGSPRACCARTTATCSTSSTTTPPSSCVRAAQPKPWRCWRGRSSGSGPACPVPTRRSIARPPSSGRRGRWGADHDGRDDGRVRDRRMDLRLEAPAATLMPPTRRRP